jgi:hypothetical protein
MSNHVAYSSQASLASLGERFQSMGIWSVIDEAVKIKQKVREHTPAEKLLDGFINILAGGIGVVEVNTRVRPDAAVQRAFGRQVCAEQSTISRTVNACTTQNVQQMRSALTTIFRQHSRSYRHDYAQHMLLIDIDRHRRDGPAGRTTG